ncbi:MAG: pyruvate dehydrogenase complex dihydrolipoamide acetyltransferase [Rhodospirillales bacterium]|nr:pyruvate dehydrogenase complex dihydrolipoamide acetyltransferase [Rhodospirillales bacterium]MYE19251.1 pyruvate dehydrogenase complex dihydrolipoamide acetyltransferase [Rhodospirillales bacterium]
MPTLIRMPALSPTMTEGTLARWLKKEGDGVEPGDVIAEIETDKATMEVEAVDEGTLGKILVADGTEGVAVNSVIAVLMGEGEDSQALEEVAADLDEPSAPRPAAITESSSPEPAPAAETSSDAASAPAPAPLTAAPQQPASKVDRVAASPLARRMASQSGLDLGSIRGSGPHGRIVKADIDRVLQAGIVPAAGEAEQPPERIELSNVRKVIAARLLEAKQTIPHFYLEADAEAGALLDLRRRINADLERERRVTVNDLVVKATAMALRRVPQVNSAWGGDHIVRHRQVHVAVAVAVDDGLFTPVVRNTDRKGILAIAGEIRALVDKTRSGKLMPEEYQGGTFSVSNLGMYGIEAFAAVINPPQGGILAVGAATERPIVRDGAVKSAPVMTLTLSGDHRVIDGAIGARWLAELRAFIEDPALMLV